MKNIDLKLLFYDLHRNQNEQLNGLKKESYVQCDKYCTFFLIINYEFQKSEFSKISFSVK